MNTLIFQNAGKIDLRTICTFGCSVKETKNPIGFFGTGMKYAFAVLLRTGHTIEVQSGLETVKVTARKGEIRGKEFDFVYVGDTAAGFTTELGKTWEPWMAYRELYCNAKDETEWSVKRADKPQAQADTTRIVVDGEPICCAHNNRDEYILEGAAHQQIGEVEVFNRPSHGFFYKGIQVLTLAKPSMFTYNHVGHVDLTEDRIVKDQSMVPYWVARNMLEYGDAAMFDKVLVASDDWFEKSFDFNWSSVKPSSDFYPTVKRIQKDSLVNLNRSALKMWREHGGGYIEPRRINMTKVQASALEKAISFCERGGINLRDQYPIMVVETLGDNCHAIADKTGKQIFLAESIFQTAGVKGVARALIEEYLHLRFDYDDCSRELQNWLFSKTVSLMEELQGESI